MENHWPRLKTPENDLSDASRGIDARSLDHSFERDRSNGFESVPIIGFIGSVPPGKEGSGWGRVGDALGHDVFRRSRASFDPAPSLSAKSCGDYPECIFHGPGRFGSLLPGCRLLGFKGSEPVMKLIAIFRTGRGSLGRVWEGATAPLPMNVT